MFNFSRVDFCSNETREQKLAKISDPWFINAHKKMISSIEIIEQSDEPMEEDSDDENIELPEGLAPEERVPWPDCFVLTASVDQDILLHRLSNGVKIGQFYQDDLWNIYDMSAYEKIRPRYDKYWLT